MLAPSRFLLACLLSTCLFLATHKALAAEVRPRDTLELVAVGDTMLGSTFPEPDELPPGDGERLLSAVAAHIQAADVWFLNLEGTLFSGQGQAKTCSRPDICFLFRMPPRYARHLQLNTTVVANLANNHSFDFGQSGQDASVRNLQAAGLHPIGVPAAPYASLDIHGIKVAFIGFAPHTGSLSMLDETAAMQQIAELKSRHDVVVVSLHAGAEGRGALHVTRQREMYLGGDRGNIYAFAHRAIDQGADLILGHGPHVLRGMELYRQRLIAYSLGNFATYGRFSLKDENSMAGLLKVSLKRNGEWAGGQFVGTRQVRGSPAWQQGITPETPAPESISLLRRLSRSDFPESPLIIEDDGRMHRRP